MATLPDLAAQTSQPVPQPAAGLAEYQAPNWRQVGLSGEIMSGAGRSFEEAANTVAATNERQDAIVAQAAANTLSQQRIQQEFGQNGFRNVQGAGTVGQQFVDKFGGQFDDSKTLIRDNLTSESQKRLFDQHAAVQGLQYKSALLSHQSQETAKFNDSTDQNSMELALRQVATNADKDLSIGANGELQDNNISFKLQMAQIEGTINDMAKRKGWVDASGQPNAIAQVLKSKMVDAAYSTRIKSIMDGIPGAVQANPYLAEKLYESVQGQLGDVSRLQLGDQVQKAVKNVQQREWADYAIFGGPARVLPSTLAPAVVGSPPLQAVVEGLESGGRDFDKNGNLLTSSKGAQGRMQVMPATAANPGFGVTPAKDNSPQELARVGYDYLGAMTARYGNPALTLAAYNAGPGQVDAWIAKYGDPRTGQISTQDWASKIPFAETQKYVLAGLQKVNANQGKPDVPVQGLTANQLKTELLPRAQAGYVHWLDAYPNDVQGAEALRSRIISNGNMVISNQQAQQAGAHDTLISGMTGQKPDGSDAPITIDQQLADPQQKTAWNMATPEVKQMIQKHYENPGVLLRSNPKTVLDLTQRIYLPDGDPQKITQPGQISEYMGKGLNYSDQQHLIKEMQEANTPEGNPLLKQVASVKKTGTDMLMGSMSAVALQHPELAHEAAYRFSVDLDNKIKAARASGADMQALFTPGNKDYVLDPNRVAAFMPTQAQIVAQGAAVQGAAKVAPAVVVAPRIANETPAQYLARVKK